jgi:ferritin-like metal-binding protein YciE
MSLNNLDELFLHDLQDTYDAERRITKALPKMAKIASSPKLRKAFEKHLTVTNKQIGRLEKVFKLLGEKAQGKSCPGMAGLIEEGSEIMSKDASEAAMDAALIGAAQKVEHYEIAAYGTMVTYAEMLGLPSAAKLLKQTLAEEKETDVELSELAATINFEAEQEDAEEPVRPKQGNMLGKVSSKLKSLVR